MFRRELLLSAACGIPVLISGCGSRGPEPTPSLRSAVGDGNWPMAGADPANSGYVDGSFPTDPTEPAELFTINSYPGGVESITTGDGVLAATFGGTKLLVWDLDDRSERWRFDAGEGEGLYPSPTVANESLYVRTPAHVRCLSLADGSTRWVTGISSPDLRPVPLGEELVVGAATEQAVVGLNARTGERRWTFETEGSPTGVAVSDDRLFVTDRGNESGRITAVDPETREAVWQRTFTPIKAPPTVTDSAVLVGDAGGMVRALSRGDGSTEWEDDVIGDAEGVQSPVATDGDHVYVTPDNDGVLSVLGAESGKEQHATEVGQSYWVGAVGDTVLFRKRSGVGVWRPGPGDAQTIDVPGNVSAVCPTDGGAFVAAGDAVYRLG